MEKRGEERIRRQEENGIEMRLERQNATSRPRHDGEQVQASRESFTDKFPRLWTRMGMVDREMHRSTEVLLAGCFGRRKKRVERKRKDWAVAAGSVAKYNPNHHPPSSNHAKQVHHTTPILQQLLLNFAHKILRYADQLKDVLIYCQKSVSLTGPIYLISLQMALYAPSIYSHSAQ
jgi:hypothetical protein